MQFGHSSLVKLKQTFYLRLLPHPLFTAGPRYKNLQKNKPSHFKLSGQLFNTGGRAIRQSRNTAFTPFMISFL